MDQNNPLRLLFKGANIYNDLYDQYLRAGIISALDPHDIENPMDAPWKMTHYWQQGSDALSVCVAALISNKRSPPKDILDLPCGSGRVTRHFKAFFPEARIVACDLYETHYSFCSRELGVESCKSEENFDRLNFDRKFDLIFCGSLLTHLNERDYKAAIDCIVRSLSDTGIAVISLSGRHGEWVQENKYQYIEPELYKKAMATVSNSGFGYVDYNEQLLEAAWNEQSHYGVAMVRPSFATKHIEGISDVRILGFVERGWDDTQDILVIGKPGMNAPNND
jgi:SAM-dependent methyltransferase